MYADLQFEHSSTVDRAADEIRRAIFAGQLEPGTPLREVALSEAMRVGRSTIRESLALLVSEGVAVRFPNKGVAVKELSAQDVSDISLARASLESSGVRRWRTASPGQRAAVRAAVDAYAVVTRQSADPAALTEAHLQIHRAFVGLTGSERLLSAADSYSGELRLGLAHLDRVRGNLAEQVESHRSLVDLLEAGDVDAAVVELARHLAAAEVSLHAAIGHGTIEPWRDWIIRVFINACGLAVAAWLFDGIVINGSSDRDRVLTLLVVALIFGVVNEFVRPIVSLLSIPLYILTLGLFYFIVNAFMLWLTSWVCDLLDIGFRVQGFWTTVFGAIVISIVCGVMGMILPANKSVTWRRTVSWR